MTKYTRWTECKIHGECPTTFICHHLVDGDELGFNVGISQDNPDALYGSAWCDECEVVLGKEGEWNEASLAYAKFNEICVRCYYEVRQKNWIEDLDAFEHLSNISYRYLHQRQEIIAENFKFGEHQRFDWDQQTGKLIFSNDNLPHVECEVSFAGSYSNWSKTWMWAWANTTLTENIKEHSRILREIGEEKRYLKLAAPIWPAEEWECWEMTAIMAKAFGAIGAYRGPSEKGYTYMIISSAKWLI